MVIDQWIDTSTSAGRIFFQILGSIAEFEHALMAERTRDGLARGRAGGQRPKLSPVRPGSPRRCTKRMAPMGGGLWVGAKQGPSTRRAERRYHHPHSLADQLVN